jgi:hypothetical protein
MTMRTYDPWRGEHPPGAEPVKPVDPPRVLSAISCILCLTPGSAARLVIVPGPGCFEQDKLFISRLVVSVDPALASRSLIEMLAERAGAEDDEVRH